MFVLVMLTAINLGTGSGWTIQSIEIPKRYESEKACAEAAPLERWNLSGNQIAIAFPRHPGAQFRVVGFRCTSVDVPIDESDRKS